MREPSRDAQAEDASWMTGLTREPASASDHSRLSAADIVSELTGLVLPAELSMAERVQARADVIRVVTDQNRRDLGGTDRSADACSGPAPAARCHDFLTPAQSSRRTI